jgi:hypothetical protein
MRIDHRLQAANRRADDLNIGDHLAELLVDAPAALFIWFPPVNDFGGLRGLRPHDVAKIGADLAGPLLDIEQERVQPVARERALQHRLDVLGLKASRPVSAAHFSGAPL